MPILITGKSKMFVRSKGIELFLPAISAVELYASIRTFLP
jgi:hypothetical protein